MTKHCYPLLQASRDDQVETQWNRFAERIQRLALGCRVLSRWVTLAHLDLLPTTHVLIQRLTGFHDGLSHVRDDFRHLCRTESSEPLDVGAAGKVSQQLSRTVKCNSRSECAAGRQGWGWGVSLWGGRLRRRGSVGEPASSARPPRCTSCKKKHITELNKCRLWLNTNNEQ